MCGKDVDCTCQHICLSYHGNHNEASCPEAAQHRGNPRKGVPADVTSSQQNYSPLHIQSPTNPSHTPINHSPRTPCTLQPQYHHSNTTVKHTQINQHTVSSSHHYQDQHLCVLCDNTTDSCLYRHTEAEFTQAPVTGTI